MTQYITRLPNTPNFQSRQEFCEDGLPLEVRDGMPEGVPAPDLDEEPQLTAQKIDPEMMADIAKRLFG